jgi:hypothetical protein
MGGYGPYSVREIEDLFRTFGFEEKTDEIDEVSGVRRQMVEEYQRAIDWSDPDQRRRYLLLVEDVLENLPDLEDGKPDPQAKAIRRALKLESLDSATAALQPEHPVDLWKPEGAPRIFLSHLAKDRGAVHDLAKVLRVFGFACFVAHDEIKPSRSWLKEIEKALGSCEILVAYITPGFNESDWTDQEVGWVLGRGLAAIPIDAGGPTAYGFLGSYQAIPARSDRDHVGLGREVFAAIVDAVFQAQRSQAASITQKVAPLVTNAFSRSTTPEKAREHFELLRQIPASAWTLPMREQVENALKQNGAIRATTLDGGPTLLAAVAELLKGR